MKRLSPKGHIESRLAIALLLFGLVGSMVGLYVSKTVAQDGIIMSTQTTTASGGPCSGGGGGGGLCVVESCETDFCDSVTQGQLKADSLSLSSDTITMGTSQISATLMDGANAATVEDAAVSISVTCTTTTYDDTDGDGVLEVVDETENTQDDPSFTVPVDATYCWTFSGGDELISGGETTATIDTSNLSADTYTVGCTVTLSLIPTTFAGKDVTCGELVQSTYSFSETLTVSSVTVTFQKPDGSALSSLVIPTGETIDIQAVIDPDTSATDVTFVTGDGNIATVSPGSASGSPQALSISGVAKGGTTISAKVAGQDVGSLSVTVEDIVWELSYWIVDDEGGGAAIASMSASSSVALMDEGGSGGDATLINDGDSIVILAGSKVRLKYEATGDPMQTLFASCDITWSNNMTEQSDTNAVSIAEGTFAVGSHSVTATANWTYQWGLPAGSQDITIAIEAVTLQIVLPSRGDGLPPSIPVGQTASVDVYFSQALVHASVYFEIEGHSVTKGSAEIVGNISLTDSGTIQVRGTAMTDPGHSGNLTIVARNGALRKLGASNGFTVCPHAVNWTISSPIAVDDPYVYGIDIIYGWDSDSTLSGINPLQLLISSNLKETIVNGIHDDPPFCPGDFKAGEVTRLGGSSSLSDHINVGKHLVSRYTNGQHQFAQSWTYTCERCGGSRVIASNVVTAIIEKDENSTRGLFTVNYQGPTRPPTPFLPEAEFSLGDDPGGCP